LSIGAHDLNVNVATRCSLRGVKAVVNDKTSVMLVRLGRMPHDSESGAFAYPQVRTLTVGGDEVLRLVFDRLRSALTHHHSGEGGQHDTCGQADEEGLGT